MTLHDLKKGLGPAGRRAREEGNERKATAAGAPFRWGWPFEGTGRIALLP